VAYFFRLICTAFLAVFSLSAHALIPKIGQYSVVDTRGASYGTYFGETPDAACQQALPGFVAKFGPGGWSAIRVAVESNGTQCRAYGRPNSNPETDIGAVAITLAGSSCPANSTASGSQCQCASGYAEFGGKSCVIDNGCLSTMGLTPPNDAACLNGECQYGYKFSSGQAPTASPYGRFCNKGCTVKGDLAACGQYSSGVMVAGQGVCIVKNSFYTGDKCVGSGEVSGPSSQGTQGGTTTDPSGVKTEANPVPERLPPGKCPGTVNGVAVVVSCDTSASNDNSTKNGTVKNADGSVTNNTTNNTTVKNTICSGGSCTTTTTVTSGGAGPNGTGAGSTTTTTSETGPKAEVCAKSPGIGACQGEDDKKPTGFGGTCGGGFKAVSEDAVINAMAEETFRQNCKVNPDDGAQTVGRDAASKTGNQTGDNPNNGSVSIGSGSFDSSNALGGVASCIADKTIVVMGKSVNIAFSMICQYLEALGLVMLGVASLLALRIVTRG
jgi:hypothetical protein